MELGVSRGIDLLTRTEGEGAREDVKIMRASL